MTRTEFDDQILAITQDHIHDADNKFSLMQDMLATGFGEPEVARILEGVRDALETASKQLARYGKPAPENCS